MKPSKQKLESAVAQLTILRYFPAEPVARDGHDGVVAHSQAGHSAV
jgi:hypothetical protein